MFAHIAGVPVEETALSLAPVVVTVTGAATVKLRGQVRRRREPGRVRPRPAQPRKEAVAK